MREFNEIGVSLKAIFMIEMNEISSWLFIRH